MDCSTLLLVGNQFVNLNSSSDIWCIKCIWYILSFISHHRDPGLSSGERILLGCVGERLTVQVVLRYRSCELFQIPSCGCKVPFGVLWRKYGSLGELGHQGFTAFLVVDWVCYRFVDWVYCAWRRLRVWILWENLLESVKPIDWWLLRMPAILNV